MQATQFTGFQAYDVNSYSVLLSSFYKYRVPIVVYVQKGYKRPPALGMFVCIQSHVMVRCLKQINTK